MPAIKNIFKDYTVMKRFKIFALIIGVLFIGRFWYIQMNTVYMSIAQINANPSAISGKILSGGHHPGLHLKDVTLKGTTFEDVYMQDAVFENVIFEDCEFLYARFWDMTMKNVRFKGGKFVAGDMNKSDKDVRGHFESANVDNVIFYGGTFDRFYINPRGGTLGLFNITRMSGEGALVSGWDAKVRIDNCNLTERGISLEKNSMIYATNSLFKGYGFGASKSTAIYVKDCVFSDSYIGAADTLVVRDSTLSGGARAGTVAYIINNDYTDQFALRGRKADARFYLLHDKKARGKINMLGGEFFVHNLETVDGAIYGWDEKLPYITSLNFKDVVIRGGNWEDLHLKGGRWENVQIYPPVDVTNAVIETVQGYNVTFPEGSPWTEKAAQTTPITTFPEGIPWRGKAARTIPITTEDKPFDWPEVRVPTPEELGLVWEWPEVTGAPRK